MIKSIIVLCLFFAIGSSFFFMGQPSLTPYNVTKSRDYSIFASLAYCPSGCLSSWTCKTGATEPLTEVSYIENNTTKAGGYIGYSSKRNLVVISFRGSANIQNWIENANFEKVPYPFCLKCEVHAGFMADYALLEPAINNRIQSILSKYPTASIVTTGHSLGGALAIISAMEIKRNFGNAKIEVHHYGAPRVGNVHLAKHINNKIEDIYRVVHNKDIVPHLPPDLPEFEYHHSAYEIFFNADMTTYKTCGSTGEDRSCSNQFFPDYTVEDHHFYFRHMSSPEC